MTTLLSMNHFIWGIVLLPVMFIVASLTHVAVDYWFHTSVIFKNIDVYTETIFNYLAQKILGKTSEKFNQYMLKLLIGVFLLSHCLLLFGPALFVYQRLLHSLLWAILYLILPAIAQYVLIDRVFHKHNRSRLLNVYYKNRENTFDICYLETEKTEEELIKWLGQQDNPEKSIQWIKKHYMWVAHENSLDTTRKQVNVEFLNKLERLNNLKKLHNQLLTMPEKKIISKKQKI